MDASAGQQNYQVSGQGRIDVEQVSFGSGASIVRPNPRHYVPDGNTQDRTAQWAADSATNPESVNGHGFPGYDSASYKTDMHVTGLAHETQGAFPLPQPDMMQNTSRSLPMYQPYGVEETYRDMSATSAGFHYSGMDIPYEIPQSHAFDLTQLIQEEQHYTNGSSVNNLAYQAMATGGFYPGLAELHPPMVLGNNDGGYPLPAEWEHQVMYQDNAVGVSLPLDYSPVSGLAPSMSSSYSQHSFLGQLPDTPVSMDLHEDWQPGEPGPMNENYPNLNVGGAMQTQQAFDLQADSERFAFQVNDHKYVPSDCPFSTIRPNASFQRTPLSMDAAWVGPEMMDPACVYSAYPGMDGSRRSSDGEPGRNARENPLYKAVPQEDGLYHCPFAVTDGCSKSPEKLKCNYE